jgi:hypothetical protein
VLLWPSTIHCGIHEGRSVLFSLLVIWLNRRSRSSLSDIIHATPRQLLRFWFWFVEFETFHLQRAVWATSRTSVGVRTIATRRGRVLSCWSFEAAAWFSKCSRISLPLLAFDSDILHFRLRFLRWSYLDGIPETCEKNSRRGSRSQQSQIPYQLSSTGACLFSTFILFL